MEAWQLSILVGKIEYETSISSLLLEISPSQVPKDQRSKVKGPKFQGPTRSRPATASNCDADCAFCPCQSCPGLSRPACPASPRLALASLSLTASGRQYRIIKGTINSLAPPHSRRFPPFPQHRTAPHRTATHRNAPHRTAALQLSFFGEKFPSLLQPRDPPYSSFHCVRLRLCLSLCAASLLETSIESCTSRLHSYKPPSNTIPHSFTPPHPVASSTPATSQPSFPTTTFTTSRSPAARSGQLASQPPWQAVRLTLNLSPTPAVQSRPRALAKIHT